MLKKSVKIFIVSIISIFFLSVAIVSAEGLLPEQSGSCPTSGVNCGAYSLNDFGKLAINIASLIMGLSGSLALLFFIYGGFMMLISAGESGKIGQAKQIITNSLIGLVLVFVSYAIVGFVLKDVLKVKGLESYTGWAKIGWYSEQNK